MAGLGAFGTLKAFLIRVIFGGHGVLAVWRVVIDKDDQHYWFLTATVFLLGFEGIFTLTLRESQDWKWFSPPVFLYLASVVPSIWIIEVDKFDERLAELITSKGIPNCAKINSTQEDEANPLDGMEIKIPNEIDPETWTMVIEQLVMLLLIFGRTMLPRGPLSRDGLIELLITYIGTSADLLDFFDSFKDEKIASNRVLCLCVLSIWSWSLLQFTVVLVPEESDNKKIEPEEESGKYANFKEVCCNLDVWAILINIILQDAPFLIFRTILVTYYKIISYMNLFFVFKNSLVIVLQLYRLYIIQMEKTKEINSRSKALKVPEGGPQLKKQPSVVSKSAKKDHSGKNRRHPGGRSNSSRQNYRRKYFYYDEPVRKRRRQPKLEELPQLDKMDKFFEESEFPNYDSHPRGKVKRQNTA